MKLHHLAHRHYNGQILFDLKINSKAMEKGLQVTGYQIEFNLEALNCILLDDTHHDKQKETKTTPPLTTPPTTTLTANSSSSSSTTTAIVIAQTGSGKTLCKTKRCKGWS